MVVQPDALLARDNILTELLALLDTETKEGREWIIKVHQDDLASLEKSSSPRYCCVVLCCVVLWEGNILIVFLSLIGHKLFLLNCVQPVSFFLFILFFLSSSEFFPLTVFNSHVIK